MLKDDEKYPINIYKIDTKVKIDKKRVGMIFIILLAFLCIILTANHIREVIQSHKVFKQYEAQLSSLNHQEEEKQAKIIEEQERIKKERLPNLTETRKAKHK